MLAAKASEANNASSGRPKRRPAAPGTINAITVSSRCVRARWRRRRVS
jgi:hypothetical protein